MHLCLCVVLRVCSKLVPEGVLLVYTYIFSIFLELLTRNDAQGRKKKCVCLTFIPSIFFFAMEVIQKDSKNR